jgi:methionyl-tRNA formyltransferase
MKKITILTSPSTWMNQYIPELIQLLIPNEVQWIHETTELCKGEICFILSFEKILRKEHLDFHQHNIVVHSSNLPQGKGMSPLSWQILEGKNNITLTLFEAVEKLDAGKIYFQDYLQFEGHELLNEMQHLMSKKICEMCLEFVRKYPAFFDFADHCYILKIEKETK